MSLAMAGSSRRPFGIRLAMLSNVERSQTKCRLRIFSASAPRLVTTVRRFTTYTSRRGMLGHFIASAMSQIAMTEVLPKPVGRLHESGNLPFANLFS